MKDMQSEMMSKHDKIKITVLILLWIAVFSPIYPELFRDWFGNPDNSHALIVPFISLYFILQNKGDLIKTSIGTSAWGAGLLTASMIAYVTCYAGALVFPSRFVMISSLFGLTWFCLGTGFIRILAFPIAFLLFMIPVPYSLIDVVSMPLQLMVTTISADLIGNCSIPVYREGNMLYFMNTQLEVAEACSGIRSLIAMTMLSTMFCYLSKGGIWRKLFLILMAIPIALLANIVRVTGTGVLAHFYGDKVAKGFLHEFSGIAVFVFGFILLFILFTILNRKKRDDFQ